MSNVEFWNSIVFIIYCCCRVLESGLQFFQHIKCTMYHQQCDYGQTIESNQAIIRYLQIR